MKVLNVSNKENRATIGELVKEDYRRAGVFKKFGIDFCCGGKTTLKEICRKKGINENSLNSALKELDEQKQLSTYNYNDWDMDRLIDHIINKHHKYLNESIPLLDEYSAKVARVHGKARPEVIEIANQYHEIAHELKIHMHKEEAILFPYIRQIALAKRNNLSLTPASFGTVRNPIHMMEMDHDSAGDNMQTIHELSNAYHPPEGACNTYRVLYAKLQEFENDLHLHIHLENNILFPKAISLEAEMLN